MHLLTKKNNIMSKIVISRNIAKLLSLSANIIKKHKADGDKSVLKSVDMKDFEAKTTQAKEAYDKAQRLRREAEEYTEKAYLLLGIHKKQSSLQPGDALYYITQCRDILKGIFRSTLRKLGEWGFQVDDTTKKKTEE